VCIVGVVVAGEVPVVLARKVERRVLVGDQGHLARSDRHVVRRRSAFAAVALVIKVAVVSLACLHT
jgi:hypothetical protein